MLLLVFPRCKADNSYPQLYIYGISLLLYYIYIYSRLYKIFNRNTINLSRVFASGPGDWFSIPGQVIPKSQKIVLDTTLLSTQHYKLRIKGKVEQSRKWSSTLPLHLGVVAIKREAFGSPSS